MDLCCGHGKPTYELLISSVKKGVSVEQIVGYDISKDQIDNARDAYSNISGLNFYVQNVEEMNNSNEFDVVISLFGLHWMENIKEAARSISNSLKSEGHLMFFVPLEKMDLFHFRNDFISQSKWSKFFNHYEIRPFISDENEYITAFDNYFQRDLNFTGKGIRELSYSKEQLTAFLSSWMQELRHLNKQSECVDSGNYVKELVESIPVEDISLPNVRKLENETIIFTEHFFSYLGNVRTNIEQFETTKMLGTIMDFEDHSNATL